jgi:hypothetical protein
MLTAPELGFALHSVRCHGPAHSKSTQTLEAPDP